MANMNWCHVMRGLFHRGRRGHIVANIQLLLLDNHTLFRAMLSRLLDTVDTESDFRVAAHCSESARRPRHILRSAGVAVSRCAP